MDSVKLGHSISVNSVVKNKNGKYATMGKYGMANKYSNNILIINKLNEIEGEI